MNMYTTAMIQLPLIVREKATRCKTPEEVRNYCKDLEDLAQESFQVLTMNARNDIIGRQMITLGVVDACLVHAREVFRAAIVAGACGVVLVHNHPSGDPALAAAEGR